MEKRTIIAIILSVLVMSVWVKFFSPTKVTIKESAVKTEQKKETVPLKENEIEKVEEIKDLLLENNPVIISFHNKKVLDINLPNFIEIEVIEAEPAAKGDTAQRNYKKVEVESGAIIQVPMFIGKGDKIKIDTRSKKYISRV